MKKQVALLLCLAVSAVMLLAACGGGTSPTATSTAATTAATTSATTRPVTTTPPSGERPKYGGTINRMESNRRGSASTWRHDPLAGIGDGPPTNEMLWEGDWARGPAGSKETDWAHSYDYFPYKRGHAAEDIKWQVDEKGKTGTIVMQVRQGVRYGLNTASEASRLVNGRQMTADDIVYCLKKRFTDPRSYLYKANPELRPAEFTKTGPWEVTAKVPLAAMIPAMTRFLDCTWIYPPEVMDKYNGMSWDNSVGTGPFILKDYVADSSATYVKNPNYWMKDPVNPQNQLPYVDVYRYYIITDISTQLAALRTGKLDYMEMLSWEEHTDLKKSTPALQQLLRTSNDGRGTPCGMRTDKAPYNDVRVRRAMVMAIDFYAIRDSLFGGQGNIITYPHNETQQYRDLYLSIDDPDLPASIKELFKYNPEKSKQLLKEAGYPTGFKTNIILLSTEVDYYSVVKNYWSKVGIDLELKLAENAVKTNIQTNHTYDALIASTTAPVCSYYLGIDKQGTGMYNTSMINDPVVNNALEEVRLLALKDSNAAQKLYRDKIAKYVLDQAYGIPNIEGVNYTMWWPWLKNYFGVRSVGYDDWHDMAKYWWIDQDMKRSMGY